VPLILGVGAADSIVALGAADSIVALDALEMADVLDCPLAAGVFLVDLHQA
jgi:hypothetical protein